MASLCERHPARDHLLANQCRCTLDQLPAVALSRKPGNYVVYLLRDSQSNKTYIGSSNHLWNRYRQHIGELKGGAKYTARWKGVPLLVGFVAGFPNKKEALSFEWRAKRPGRSPSFLTALEHRHYWRKTAVSTRAVTRLGHLVRTAGHPRFESLKLSLYLIH